MKRKLSLILILCVMFSLCYFTVNAQTDDYSKYSILKELEIMVGDANGEMRWNDTVTRAEFTKVATMISSYRKSIALNQKTSPFSDVPYKHWAVGYIRAGVDNGIINGYPDSTFKPEKEVLYEEALTILLKILGYTDADCGSSYPSGQYSLANNIDLTDGIDAKLGEKLTRKQVADLLLNALETKVKNGSFNLYNNFDVVKMEDVVLLATSKEDVSVPLNKVMTTNGVLDYNIDVNNLIGEKGTIFVKNGDTIILFEADEKGKADKQVVYSALSDGVIVYRDGNFEQIDIDDNTITYYNNKQTVFGSVKTAIQMGDTISIYKTENEEIDYISINKGNLSGPYVYKSKDKLQFEDYLILRNGSSIEKDDLEINDVYYYSEDLGIVMVYNTKITGIYNSATPNQEVPASVEISGKVYEIESAEAFKSLSSTGKFKYGDTITALLGKDKKIAAVIDADSVGVENIGYLVNAGIKNYDTDNDKKVSEYYISVVMTDGELVEYKARTDFSNYINSIVEITFKNDLASISRIRENNKKQISGTFNSESMYIGNYAVSKHVDIIDIGTTDNTKSALYVVVEPQRLDGVRLSSSDILYYEMNEKNAITKLVLKNVTGDYYSYGIVTKVQKDSERMFGTYNYNIDGSEKVHSTQNSVLGVSAGPAKIIFSNNTISSMTNLTKINGKIEELNNTYATVGKNHYLLDDDVKIYYKNYNWDYMLITMEDLLEDEDYQIVGLYYDKSITSGGRVRVILVTKY